MAFNKKKIVYKKQVCYNEHASGGKMEIKIETILEKQSSILKNNYIGTKTDNVITYNDSSCSVEIIIEEEVKMIRESFEFKLELTFSKEKTLNPYLLKSTNHILDIEIETKVIEIEDNKLYIEYLINEDKCKFTLNWSD